jgi:hypothetical protein
MRFRGVLHAKGVQILTRGGAARTSMRTTLPPLPLQRARSAFRSRRRSQRNQTKPTKTTAFLPTLEKFGRTAQLLLSPNEVHFVQTALNTDGPHVTARFDVGTLFVVEGEGEGAAAGGGGAAGNGNAQPTTTTTSYRVSSRHHNLIAVSLDVGLLAKALRSAAAAAAQAGLGQGDPLAGVVDVRLTQRVVPTAAGAAAGGAAAAAGAAAPATPAARPFLAFGVRGALAQDLPVSRPFAPAEVDRLAGAKDVAELCDYYVDLADCGVRWLQQLCERVRGVAEKGVGAVATAASGDLHVSTAAGGGGGGAGGGGEASGVGAGGRPLLGTLVQGLRVLPAS